MCGSCQDLFSVVWEDSSLDKHCYQQVLCRIPLHGEDFFVSVRSEVWIDDLNSSLRSLVLKFPFDVFPVLVADLRE